MNVDWSLALSVLFSGIVIVFIVLIILIIVVGLFDKVLEALTGKKKKEKAPKEPTPPAPKVEAPKAAPVALEAKGDDDEVIAVISAAVAPMGSEDGKTYRIKSVKRVREARNPWHMAGISQNTMPF